MIAGSIITTDALVRVGIYAVPLAATLAAVRRRHWPITAVCLLQIASSILVINNVREVSSLIGVVTSGLIALGMLERIRHDPQALIDQLAAKDHEWAIRVHDARNEGAVWQARAVVGWDPEQEGTDAERQPE